jgi:hypothetical protein
MADNIIGIDFSNVSVSGSAGTATISGTIDVDYTTDTVTGSLTATVPGQSPETFTSFQYANPSTNVFHITSSVSGPSSPPPVATLSMIYTSQSPTSLATADYNLTGVGDFNTLVNNSLTSTPVCFVAGTLIRTPKGDVPVETLQIGDLVITGSGEARPVKWIGHRDIDIEALGSPRSLLPVRIAADAFGPSRPSQDLYVSVGHSICVDLCGEVLIPVVNLINGATVTQVTANEVSYWHVELDSHDILIANNLPAESYLAMGNRGYFELADATIETFLDGRDKSHADFCRPVVQDGPVLAFVRQRLIERASALGWTPSRDPDLHLIVDGEIRCPLKEAKAAVFLFPAGAQDVRLISDTFAPARLGSSDQRELGLCVTGLSFAGTEGEPRLVSPADQRLKNGFHPQEGQDGATWRWTNGELMLPAELWSGLSGEVALLIAHQNSFIRRWDAPERTSEVQVPASRPALYAVS